MPEVQKHGFSWEKDLIYNVYGATQEELKNIKYTNKMDLPASCNHLDGVDLSIKTSCSSNSVCMADCLRIYDAVSTDKPFHMTVIYYIQDEANTTKTIRSITEVDLTNSVSLLFGTLTRVQIEELDKLVKMVPQKRSPTPEEHEAMYTLKNKLQALSGAIRLDIKCNSQQSRLQCSFNHFQEFLEKNKNRCVAQSNTSEFRGKKITEAVSSSRRVFKKKDKPAEGSDLSQN